MISAIEAEQMFFISLYDELKAHIRGDIYPSGCRPYDSKSEDAVISISTLTATQVQEGILVINIFVPNLDNGSRRLVPDRKRLHELSTYANGIIDFLRQSSMKFEHYSAPQIIENENGTEYFVNIMIKFNTI